MDSARYAIIGAGLAGAATAYHLAQAGRTDVVVLEREPLAGAHASGRNAGMVRQVVADGAIAALAREGAAFIRERDGEWRLGFQPSGSMLLLTGEMALPGGEALTPGETVARVPVLRGARFDRAVACATDGVVDVSALLQGYLRRGAWLKTESAVTSIDARPDGFVVRTARESIRAEVVINAAGAWAGPVARLAGASDVGLRAFRRHLFATGPLPWVRPDWPFVWHLADEVYFRPESGGLLLSPCDEDEHPPGEVSTDPTRAELLARKLARTVPALADLPIARGWAGLRTFAPDRRFVIGWDPRRRGLFWVAGLGGHGVTASAAVGRLAAELLAAGPGRAHEAFDPARPQAPRQRSST